MEEAFSSSRVCNSGSSVENECLGDMIAVNSSSSVCFLVRERPVNVVCKSKKLYLLKIIEIRHSVI